MSEQGEALFQELLWVHDAIRRDLATVRVLADRVVDDLTPSELQAELDSLATNGPLWHLKVNCLYYCRFVHQHHRLEDIALFPALRRANPELDGVVDRLESDHRKVSDRLEEVESAAADLARSDAAPDRARVARALETLAEELLAHLELEEETVGPTMRRMTRHPLA